MSENRPDPEAAREPGELPTRALLDRSVHHDYIWARLPFVVPMAAKVAARCCGSCPDCDRLSEIVAELHTVLSDHLIREERILLAGAGPGADVDLTELRWEHATVRDLLDRARAASGLPRTAGPEACPTERALLHELDRLDDHIRRQLATEDQLLGR